MAIMVDSNVILDMVNQDPLWLDWSRSALEQHLDGGLLVNAVIYSELCSSANTAADVDALLEDMALALADIPREALFLASKAHLSYRRQGGTKASPLPDFFIGAHAQVLGIPILTRDQGRYRTYFPHVALICP
jgi:predicted nucleic acid-binding protein